MRLAPRTAAAYTFVAVLAAACSGGGATIGAGGPPSPTNAPTTSPSGAPSAAPSTAPSAAPTGSISAGKIKHIVVIIQENRSFDNIFHGFSEPSGAKADYADYGYDKTGNKIALVSWPYETVSQEVNDHKGFLADYDGGKMDGFFAENAASGLSASQNGNNGMSYVPQQEVQPYFDMAAQGALAERYFDGVSSESYPSYLMMAAGSTTYDNDPGHRVIKSGMPNQDAWGCGNIQGDTVPTLLPNGSAGPNVPPCYTGVTTIADLLQTAHHTWHWYSPYVAGPVNGMPGGATTLFGHENSFQSYRQMYFGSTWSVDSIQPETLVLADVPSGMLADVTFVSPDAQNSEHQAVATSSGPAWVTSVVNVIGQSQFWNSTAIFVTWDDPGGFYDHVPPPQVDPPYGFGCRMGLIAISPYAKHGQLVDTVMSNASVLKFIEETFGLPSLGRQDAIVNSASAMFDFNQAPAPYKTVTAALRRRDFLAQKPSGLPPDTDMLGDRDHRTIVVR